MANRSVVIELKGRIGDFESKMRRAGATATSEMDKLHRNVRDNRAAMDELGGSAGKMGLAAAAGLVVAAKAAIDWESAWAGVTKTVDGSAEEMAQLETELRDLAKALPATHGEIAAVAEAAGQLGVARQDIASFTETMIALSETTNLTADEAATSIAQLANVMQTAPDQIDNLGAALVALGNDGASTERDIILMAQRIAGAAEVVGLAESDVLALANAVSSMGIDVEAGGSSVSRVLTEIGKATAQGGDQLTRFAEVAGVSGQQFAQSFGETPAQAFAQFITGLGEIQAAGGDVFTTLEQLGLSDIRVSQALIGMASAGDLLTDSLELGSRAWEENTALALEAAKRYETTEAQMQRSLNQLKDAAIEVGAAILPVLASVAGGVGDMAEAFSELPGPAQETVTALLGITAVFGGGLWFTSKVIGGIADTRKALDDLGVSAGKTGKAMKGLGVAAAALAAVTLIDALQRQADDAGPSIEKLTQDLLDLSDAANTKNLGKHFDDLGKHIDRIADKNVAQKLEDSLGGAIGVTDSALEEAEAAISGLDAALALMVSSGNADAAADALANLVPSGVVSESDFEKLTPQLTEYKDALLATENQSRLTGGAQDELTGAMGRTGGAAEREAQAIQESVDAMKEKADAANNALSAELGYAQALLDSEERVERRKELEKELSLATDPEERRRIREELDLYNRTLDTSTQAGIDNLTTLQQQAEAWNRQDDATKRAKGSYEKARRELIDTALQFGATKKEAKKYADTLLEDIPQEIKTKVHIELGSFTGFTDLERKLGVVIAQGRGGHGGLTRAGGGPITGPGTGTSDSIPALLSNGEHVVTAAEVQAAGGHAGVYAWRRSLRGYASGGEVFASRPAPSLGAGFDLEAVVALAAKHARPIVGHQTVMPHNYSEFERQRAQNEALAGLDGVQR